MDSNQLSNLISSVLGKIPYPWSKHENCYSRSARELILATILHESDGGRYIKQVGGGPGTGIIQMEPPTFRDIMDYMKRNKNWKNWGLTRQAILMKFSVGENPTVEQLEWNNGLAIAMCRVHYLRAPHSLPPHDNLDAISRYWFEHYNRGDNPIQKIKEFKEDYKHFTNN